MNTRKLVKSEKLIKKKDQIAKNILDESADFINYSGKNILKSKKSNLHIQDFTSNICIYKLLFC